MSRLQNSKDAIAKKHQPAQAEDLDLGPDESEEDSDDAGDSSRTPSEAEKLASLRADAKAKRLALEKKQKEGAPKDQNKMRALELIVTVPEGMYFAICYGLSHDNVNGIVFRGIKDGDKEGLYHDI